VLELSGAGKRYGADWAVQPLDLAVPARGTTVLIGPSGCGKSTLLRLMMGLIPADAGQVRLDGEVLDGGSALRLRQRMGYVIQEGGLFPHLTARENVTLMARHLGRAGTDGRVAALAELTRLPAELLDRFPAELSGGQRQRVALMRALMLDPEVLLLDEPLGALDPMIRFDLQDDLRRVFRTLGKTVVMVTHDLAEAGFFADHIVLLRGGRVVQRGGLHDLLHAPADDFVRRFVGAQRSVLDVLEERA
jgi:osmoprotectant transport system ATP-binding protein